MVEVIFKHRNHTLLWKHLRRIKAFYVCRLTCTYHGISVDAGSLWALILAYSQFFVPKKSSFTYSMTIESQYFLIIIVPKVKWLYITFYYVTYVFLLCPGMKMHWRASIMLISIFVVTNWLITSNLGWNTNYTCVR